jgi:hypothetical protein
VGAVTTERTSVSGCRMQPLGVMRYIPVAGKSYVKRYLADDFTAHAVAQAPSLAWNRDDALQDMLVRKAFRRDIARPQHFVPTAEGFGAPVRTGLGWGMFPDSSPQQRWPTVRSSGSLVCTSMCRCSGSVGSWKARWSKPSPTSCGLARRICTSGSSGSTRPADWPTWITENIHQCVCEFCGRVASTRDRRTGAEAFGRQQDPVPAIGAVCVSVGTRRRIVRSGSRRPWPSRAPGRCRLPVGGDEARAGRLRRR